MKINKACHLIFIIVCLAVQNLYAQRDTVTSISQHENLDTSLLSHKPAAWFELGLGVAWNEFYTGDQNLVGMASLNIEDRQNLYSAYYHGFVDASDDVLKITSLMYGRSKIRKHSVFAISAGPSIVKRSGRNDNTAIGFSFVFQSILKLKAIGVGASNHIHLNKFDNIIGVSVFVVFGGF